MSSTLTKLLNALRPRALTAESRRVDADSSLESGLNSRLFVTAEDDSNELGSSRFYCFMTAGRSYTGIMPESNEPKNPDAAEQARYRRDTEQIRQRVEQHWR